mmetsp:Transcript_22067/g.63325  ORF Transcript_22067/g.63325 Transcript_22067/m.63325 type:complete len:171 (-) Transcript_22067:123-635(-)
MNAPDARRSNPVPRAHAMEARALTALRSALEVGTQASLAAAVELAWQAIPAERQPPELEEAMLRLRRLAAANHLNSCLRNPEMAQGELAKAVEAARNLDVDPEQVSAGELELRRRITKELLQEYLRTADDSVLASTLVAARHLVTNAADAVALQRVEQDLARVTQSKAES